MSYELVAAAGESDLEGCPEKNAIHGCVGKRFYDIIGQECVPDDEGIRLSNGHCYHKGNLRDWLKRNPDSEDLFGGKFEKISDKNKIGDVLGWNEETVGARVARMRDLVRIAPEDLDEEGLNFILQHAQSDFEATALLERMEVTEAFSAERINALTEEGFRETARLYAKATVEKLRNKDFDIYHADWGPHRSFSHEEFLVLVKNDWIDLARTYLEESIEYKPRRQLTQKENVAVLRALNAAENDLNRDIVRRAQEMFYEKYVEEYDWEGSNLNPREERYLEDPGWV